VGKRVAMKLIERRISKFFEGLPAFVGVLHIMS
jgi:hypothetical protein